MLRERGSAAAARDAESGAAVSLDICSDTQYEARSVVSRVREALASGAETVAVLVRRRADLAEILPALRAADIAFSAVDLDRLSDRQAMLDLLSLAHALVQPEVSVQRDRSTGVKQHLDLQQLTAGVRCGL